MGLFSKSIGTQFLKESSDVDKSIEKLQNLKKSATGDNLKQIEKQLNFISSGKFGEKNIDYELRSSGMDMYVLHDICLEYGELSAQIDYLVITRKRTYVIECKMLTGNIEIDNTGAFIRNYEYAGKKIREGIYSPITQNRMHLQVIKEIWKNNKENLFTKNSFEKNFDNNFQSIIVLANHKTCIDMKYAPQNIKDQVIRADQLISYISQKDNDCKNDMSNKEMKEIAEFFLRQHRPNKFDYLKKYEAFTQTTETSNQQSKYKGEYIRTQMPAINKRVLLDDSFLQIKNENDIERYSYALLEQLKSENNTIKVDLFFEKAALLWLQATIGYIWYEAPIEEKNIPMLIEILESEIFKDHNINYESAVDMLFAELEQKNKKHYAVLKRKNFKMEAGINAESIINTLKIYFNISPKSKDTDNSNSKEKLIKNLKAFRLKKSKSEGIKPYYIFNDAQMEDLIIKMPQTKDDLLKVSGFGSIKVNKYGEDILKILHNL